MRVLVTGSQGMLGRDLCRIFGETHEVLGVDLEGMDVRDPEAVLDVAVDFQPDLFVHLAAMTNVDGCETDPDEAYRSNTIGTRNVVLACRRLEAVFVLLSTGAVFDGEKPEPYLEYDTPNPQSVYGRSKHGAEQIVQSMLARYYIVRAGWMFGGGPADKKFVAKIVELAKEREELRVVNDKVGSPTYTVDLSRGLVDLVESDLYGIYHMTNQGWCSRDALARHILECAGINGCQVVPVSSDEYPLPAPRPNMEALRNLSLELSGFELLPPWEEAIERYLKETLL